MYIKTIKMATETVTIAITKETHSRIKEYCDEYGFKMQGWIDHALREKLDKINK